MPVQTIVAILQLQRPEGSGVQLVTERCTPAAKRNLAITRFLNEPQYQWIFFLDSDMVPAPDTLKQLLATGCDVVGGLYAGRVFGERGWFAHGSDRVRLRVRLYRSG